MGYTVYGVLIMLPGNSTFYLPEGDYAAEGCAGLRGAGLAAQTLGGLFEGLRFRGLGYSPPGADRTWLWVYYNKIPIYLIFYLLQGGYRLVGSSAALHAGL